MICRYNIICAYKPTVSRIVISALQVIETGLIIVVVSAVSDRIDNSKVCFTCDLVAVCIGYRNKVTPCVVGVVCYNIIINIKYLYYVTLKILLQIVLSITASCGTVGYGIYTVVFIIVIQKICSRTPFFSYKPITVIIIILCYSIRKVTAIYWQVSPILRHLSGLS